MPTASISAYKAVSPLLARNAVPRTGTDNLPGYYSTQHDMWVVETPNGTQPVIARGALDELLTKTKVNSEEDDDSFVTLETLTKTYSKPESDDDLASKGQAPHLLQLMTKTDTVIEEDDTGDSYWEASAASGTAGRAGEGDVHLTAAAIDRSRCACAWPCPVDHSG